MPDKRVRMNSGLEYVRTAQQVRRLVALVARKHRGFAKALIQASTNTRSSYPEQLAAYQRRIAHSIVNLETNEKSKKAKRREDPIRWFAIGVQEAVELYDPDLGNCAIRYYRSSEIRAGWWTGQRFLEDGGGVVFTFLDGLPEGATLYFYLCWTSGNRQGTLFPFLVATPRGTLTGMTPVEGEDFRWTILRSNTQVQVCIANQNPNGTIATGVDCRISYY